MGPTLVSHQSAGTSACGWAPGVRRFKRERWAIRVDLRCSRPRWRASWRERETVAKGSTGRRPDEGPRPRSSSLTDSSSIKV